MSSDPTPMRPGSASTTYTAPVVAQDITKIYASQAGPTTVLGGNGGINLHVNPGEFVALVGPSGSGKSTLMHILGALDAPSSGTVELAGCETTAMTEHERTTFRGEHVGFVFQAFHLIDSLTIEENVALPAIVAGTKRSAWRPRSLELLEHLGLADKARAFPAKLSGGQRQRVAVARALFARPQVILADEPTGNLDTTSGAKVLDLLTGAVRSGAASCVVMVTHDAGVASAADRLVYLRDGQITADVLTSDICGTTAGGEERAHMVGAWLATAGR